MREKFLWAMLALMLCVYTSHAFMQEASALGEITFVTKATQIKQGLEYTLAAERVDDKAVLVRMEIARTGKLKDIRGVSMRIGEGRPTVYAPLQTTPGKNDAWVVSFQISPDLAGKCYIDLIASSPHAGLTSLIYAVELKGYVTDKE